jgi:hypothetical protein
MDLKGMWRGFVDWIRLVQDMFQWRTFPDVVRTLGFHKEEEYLYQLKDY